MINPQPRAESVANPNDPAQQRIKTMQNIRGIILRCYGFADSHKGAWPSSLDQLSKPSGAASEPSTSPTLAQQTPSYVYLPPKDPAKLKDPGRQIVLYERFDNWDGGIYVGYADGHAQYVQDEGQFRKQLASQRS